MKWRRKFLVLALVAFWGYCVGTRNVHADQHTLYLKAKQNLDSYRGQTKYLAEASRLTRILEEKFPASPLTLVSRGRLIFIAATEGTKDSRQILLDKAQDFFERAGEIAPDFVDPCIYKAYALMAGDKAEGLREATMLAARADKLAPGSPWVELLMAIIAQRKGKEEEMHARMRRVLVRTSHPGLVSMAHDYLARYFLRKKDYSSAKKSFLKILELNPDSPRDHAIFSLFLSQRNDFDLAIEYGEKALEIMDFGAGHKILGRAYYGKGAELHWNRRLYEESKIYFLKALQHDPILINAHYGLGMAYYQCGYRNKNAIELERAEKELVKVLELQPDHRRAREQLANLRKFLHWLTEGDHEI